MTLVYKEVLKTKREVVALICNKCKKTFRKDDDEASWALDLQEAVTIDACGSYGSAGGDHTSWSVTLCDNCSHKLFKDIADVD